VIRGTAWTAAPDESQRQPRTVKSFPHRRALVWLAYAEGTLQRFYSLSAQMQHERKQYDDPLETTQRGALDVTPWLSWFLACLLRAVHGADGFLAGVLSKARFWQRWAGTPMNARQTLVLNHVLDGMAGKLTNARWAAMSKCSADTALLDINDLLARWVLRKLAGGGGVRGIFWSNRPLDLGINWSPTPFLTVLPSSPFHISSRCPSPPFPLTPITSRCVARVAAT